MNEAFFLARMVFKNKHPQELTVSSDAVRVINYAVLGLVYYKEHYSERKLVCQGACLYTGVICYVNLGKFHSLVWSLECPSQDYN
jgi:hypothetical protein